MAPIDIDQLIARGPSSPIEELRLEIFELRGRRLRGRQY